MKNPTTDDLAAALVTAMRHYAQLASYVDSLGTNEGAQLLARHAREAGMSDWHAKYFDQPTIQQSTTPE